jgi:hypothetical protein
MGANVYFQFSLGMCPAVQAPASLARQPEHKRVQPQPPRNFDLSKAVVLVSCVKRKGPRHTPARLLYTSDWFQKVRNIVESSGARWFILSARYGLVAPDAEIEPYERTLNTLGVAERKAWAKGVLDKLLPKLVGEDRVVMFAGQRYREFLVEPLRKQGIKVEVPMAHLGLFKQLAWLSEH